MPEWFVSRVGFLTQVFGLVMVSSPSDWGHNGGVTRRSIGISHFRVFDCAQLW